jgi:hypothetical protein
MPKSGLPRYSEPNLPQASWKQAGDELTARSGAMMTRKEVWFAVLIVCLFVVTGLLLKIFG